MTRRAWTATAGAALLVLGVVAGIVVGSKITTPQQAAARARPPAQGPVLAPLEKRALTLGVTARGTVAPGGGLNVPVPAATLATTAVVTRVDIAVNDTIGDGQLLMDVSGQPLVSAVLRFPLYRDIQLGVSGPDVDELNDFLDRQGVQSSNTATVDGNFATGVRQLLRRWGYPDIAQAVPLTDAPAPTAAASPAPTDDAKSQAVFKLGWIVPIDRAGRTISALHAAIGTTLTADKGLMTLDASAPTVRGYLDSEATQHVRTGIAALAVDDATNRQIALTVTTVDASDTTDPTTGAPGRAVTLNANDPSQLVGVSGSLTLNLTVPLSDQPELVVPIAAVRTTATGDSSIVAVDNANTQVRVSIAIGTCSDGWCQLRQGAENLAEGQLVVVSDTGS